MPVPEIPDRPEDINDTTKAEALHIINNTIHYLLQIEKNPSLTFLDIRNMAKSAAKSLHEATMLITTLK